MKKSTKLLLSLSQGVPTVWPPRNDDGTTFDVYADLIAGIYGYNGVAYADYASWLTALGGSDLADPQFTFPWDTSVGTVLIEGLTPDGVSAIGNAFQIDDGTDNSRVALQRDTSQIPGARIVRTTTTQLSVSFNQKRDLDSFRFAMSTGATAQGGAFLSWLGADAVNDTSVNVPTVTIFRAGNNAAGDRPWTGELWKIAVSRKRNSAARVKALATPVANFLVEGDSGAGGAGGASFSMSMCTLQKVYIINSGVGGDTLINEVARVAANPLRGQVHLILFDLDNNGYDPTIPNDVARYQQAYDACGGNITIMTPLPRAGQTAPQNQACKDLAAALLASAMSARVFNTLAAFDAITPGSSGNAAASLLQGDGVHPTDATCDAIAPVLRAFTGH